MTSKTTAKRLIFITAALSYGGAERVMVNLINRLARGKYKIALVFFENKLGYHRDLPSSVRLICLDKKNRWDFLKLIFRLRKVIIDYKPSVVISFLYYINIVTVLSTLFLKRDFRLILSERTYHRLYLRHERFAQIKRWFMRFAYKKADRIVVVSESIGKALREDFAISPERLKTIYNPVDFELISNMSKNEIMHPFFQNKDARIIIAAGRLIIQKRFDRLLRIFSMVREKQDNVYLIIVGSGELCSELESLASALKISECVDFVGYQDNPYAWISKADIFTLTSDCEGFPNVILEAMTCGTPVISADCPSGPNEIIEDRKDGILIHPSDEIKFRDAILELLGDSGLRKALAENARKKIERFSVQKITAQYEEAF